MVGSLLPGGTTTHTSVVSWQQSLCGEDTSLAIL